MIRLIKFRSLGFSEVGSKVILLQNYNDHQFADRGIVKEKKPFGVKIKWDDGKYQWFGEDGIKILGIEIIN